MTAKKKILFIMNPISGTVRKTGIPKVVEDNLDKDCFDFDLEETRYSGHAYELATDAKVQGYDAVVAVGGDGTVNEVARAIVHSDIALGIVPCGSGNGLARHLMLPMDAAKAIALGAVYNGDVWDFWRKRAVPTDRLPVACVVTIPASGSEASNSSVISNDEEHLKCGLGTDLNRPVLAIIDPELTFTLPPYQTAAGVTDMIAHIMERFFSGQPGVAVTDNIALGMIRAVMDAAPRVMENPEDYDARANIMWVGTLAHNGLAGLGLGNPGGRDGDWTCHGMEHELSAFDTSITHGAGLAVIFPAWMRYVWREHPERFLEFGRQVFGIEPVDPAVDDLSGIDEEITPERAVADAVEETIDELQDFFASLGMPRSLSEFGMTGEDVEKLLPGLKINRGEKFGSFKQLTLDDARQIYLSAL